MGRASDAPVVASAGTQAEPRTPASWLLFADRSQTAAPLPVGSDPRSVRRTEPFHKAPLPSSPALGRYAKGLPCCRNFTPAQPDRPAASMRDFCSGAYMPDWIAAHVRAFAYFDGAARQTVSDNLKAGITKAC